MEYSDDSDGYVPLAVEETPLAIVDAPAANSDGNTNDDDHPPSTRSRNTVINFKRGASRLKGMYRDLGDAAAYEIELEAMNTPAQREAEELNLFTEEVMKGL